MHHAHVVHLKPKPAAVAPVEAPAPQPAPEPEPAPEPPPEPVAPPPPPSLPIAAPYTYANTYAYGNCTWYVASVKPIPGSWGNANTWASRAAADGYVVSGLPMVGAVAQNTTDSWLGHVAVVVVVVGDQVLLSEMNYEGFGVISQRWANVSQYQYIYV